MKDVGKKIKKLVDNFYKTPIGELPKTHFWVDRDNHLCCGQIRSKIIVDTNEVKQKVFDEMEVIFRKWGYAEAIYFTEWVELKKRHLSPSKEGTSNSRK